MTLATLARPALAVLALGVVALLVRTWLRHAELTAGKQLFSGDVSLKGHMTGDQTLLPGEAVRCRNCHGQRTSSGAPERFGSELSEPALAHPVGRRGGPPSSYDAAAFCRLLREGIDPAQVVIPKAMPRYLVSDQECQALWAYVTSN